LNFEIKPRPNKLKYESISSKDILKSRTFLDKNGSMERKSNVPKLKFGELKPDSVPVFGYPFVNYSPTNKHENDGTDQGKECSDKLWQVFSGAIVYQANCAGADGGKMLLAEMIDQREDNLEKEEHIQKALTFGFKLPTDGINDRTVQKIDMKDKYIKHVTLCAPGCTSSYMRTNGHSPEEKSPTHVNGTINIPLSSRKL
jgi:hypothetical protein